MVELATELVATQSRDGPVIGPRESVDHHSGQGQVAVKDEVRQLLAGQVGEDCKGCIGLVEW